MNRASHSVSDVSRNGLVLMREISLGILLLLLLMLLRCEIAWSVDRLARRIVGIIG